MNLIMFYKLCRNYFIIAYLIFFRGEEFRPSYSALGQLRSHHDDTPFLLLTATCSPKILNDITTILHLKSQDVNIIARNADRY